MYVVLKPQKGVFQLLYALWLAVLHEIGSKEVVQLYRPMNQPRSGFLLDIDTLRSLIFASSCGGEKCQ
jgi:hypothetical protein